MITSGIPTSCIPFGDGRPCGLSINGKPCGLFVDGKTWGANIGSIIYIGDIANGRGGWALCAINDKTCGTIGRNGGAIVDGRFLGSFVDGKSWKFGSTFDDGTWGATNVVKPSFVRPTKVSGKFSFHKLWGILPIVIEHNLLDTYWFQFPTDFSHIQTKWNIVEKIHSYALQPHLHTIFWGNPSFQNQITFDGYFCHPYFQTHHLIIQFAL